jgi:hypothetical protein
LAAGLPVVATPLPEVMRLERHISLATTPQEYVREVSRLLGEGAVGPSRQRSEQMAGESWDFKVVELEQLLTRGLEAARHKVRSE